MAKWRRERNWDRTFSALPRVVAGNQAGQAPLDRTVGSAGGVLRPLSGLTRLGGKTFPMPYSHQRGRPAKLVSGPGCVKTRSMV
jgi:hypothetical protein